MHCIIVDDSAGDESSFLPIDVDADLDDGEEDFQCASRVPILTAAQEAGAVTTEANFPESGGAAGHLKAPLLGKMMPAPAVAAVPTKSDNLREKLFVDAPSPRHAALAELLGRYNRGHSAPVMSFLGLPMLPPRDACAPAEVHREVSREWLDALQYIADRGSPPTSTSPSRRAGRTSCTSPLAFVKIGGPAEVITNVI